MMKIYDYQYFLRAILQCSRDEVETLTEKKSLLYESFEIPKKNGMREIHALAESKKGKKLMQIQKNLHQRFLCRLPIAVPAHGFVKGKNYQTFLEPHLGNEFFMRLDIEDFFPSFSMDLMRKILREHIEDERALADVMELCTLDDKLPQGICTSPVLSNILFRRIDQRILKYCQTIEEGRRMQNRYPNESKIKICYTRYADDLLFSSDQFDFKENLHFLRMIRRILKEDGFRINKQKTIMEREKIVLNGYVLDDKLHLSRKKLQNLRRILYFFRKKNAVDYAVDTALFLPDQSSDKQELLRKLLQELNYTNIQDHGEKKTFNSISSLIQYLCGYRSWLISIIQTGDERDKADEKIPRYINRIELLLQELEKQEA